MTRLAALLFVSLLVLAGVTHAEEAPRPIRLNQMGLEANGPKRAVLADASKSPLDWTLLDASGATVASGKTKVFGDNAASGEHVHQIDFSSVRKAGDGYRLTVGAAESRPFALRARPDGKLTKAALSFFYQQRASVPIEARFVERPDLARPAGHAPDKATCFDLADERGQVWPGCDYTLDASDGWYDAGDHGKYVVNGGVSVWTLVNAYERAAVLKRPGALKALGDGSQALPENANGVPDILDEARFELSFLLAMQVPDGKTLQVPVGKQKPVDGKLKLTAIDASGMAHQKIADRNWTGLPTSPADDKEVRYLYYPTTGATLNLAAVTAQAARVWKTIDPAFSARCLEAARRAFAAALRHPDIYQLGPFTGSGGYGDGDLTDELYWAAAELYATTGDANAEKVLRASPLFLATSDISWGSVGALGTITLALVPSGLKPAEITQARTSLMAAAGRYLSEDLGQGYGLPYAAPGYPWGSNSSVLNRAVVLGLAYDFTGEIAYRFGAVDAMDYVLGRNPLDRSYVTGFGARAMQNPHHRFWARQANAAYPAPPAGVVSGGPNSTNMGDDVAKTMKGQCKPQTCWTDDYRAFTQNEVAINWNAPLVWASAFLDDTMR
ncbi:glycoside hydrolase family 9 protein [Caulobacter sp.]|uniref:glycoside hydrolase family 9 protein n=1 Tax=Caulobacter sp. TaxID=78 RepID=UPI001B29A04E|nr:glycoside hydrolase family 9 protein [Caulobacter sp.]MBO9544296.1 glycoside hydrolase family 9 protein [Caulobacter sp.]